MTLRLALVGRPNVGKSTLFNRLARKKLAIVDDTPGVTRDWRLADADFYGESFIIIDTAGLEEAFDSSIEARMRKQTEGALDQADAALFIIDGRAGVTPMDQHFAELLRKNKMPVILVINKCETEKVKQEAVADAYSLGLGDPITISAEHGQGMDVLFDAVEPLIEEFDQSEKESADEGEGEDQFFANMDLDALEGDDEFDFVSIDESAIDDTEKPIKIAIVGRPNAGKSTLLNTLVGGDRVMTGPEAGITRDAISVEWTYEDRPFKLVDTAGLRKRAKVHQKLERMAVDDTMRAIRLAQVVILVLDGELMMEKQDLSIAEHVINEGRALIIAVNKWDAVKNKKEATIKLEKRLERSMGQISDIPVVTISALKDRNIGSLMHLVMDTYDHWNRRVQTGQLNRWLSYMESHHPAPLVGGRPNRIKYITQIKNRPPTFVMWVSHPKKLPESYKRYIVNGLRKDFDISGVPIRLLVRTSKNPYN